MGDLDHILSGVIVLFILSVIVEKITSLIRTYPNLSWIPALFTSLLPVLFFFGFFSIAYFSFFSILYLILLTSFLVWRYSFRALLKSTPGYFYSIELTKIGISEDVKSRQIFLLSLSVGIIIAFAFRVDFFYIFSRSDITSTIGWIDENFTDWRKTGAIWFSNMAIDGSVENTPAIVDELQAFFGIITTGFFLSFGSKFFHDLLDTLFFIKNYRKKLVDDKTYQVSSTAELEQHLNVTESDIIHKALTANREKIIRTEGVNSVGKGKTENGEIGLIITADSPSVEQNLKDYFQVEIDSQFYEVPYEIEITKKPSIRSYYPGDKIHNSGNSNGSLGCIVEDKYNGSKFILSCYHVLINLEKGHKWESFIPKDEEDRIVKDQYGNRIALLTSGLRDTELDAAIAYLDDQNINIDDVNRIGDTQLKPPNEFKDILHKAVRFKGANTKKITWGVIFRESVSVELQYNSSEKWVLNELLAISTFENGLRKDISKKGDSGSFFIDREGHAIGLLVGGDSAYTYAIPIDKILKTLQVRIPIIT